jgi:uncharacterized membrane protein
LSVPDLPPPRKPRHRVIERLRAYFIAGILVAAPILLTVYIVVAVVNLIDSIVLKLLPESLAKYLDIPGLGVVMAVAALTLIGAATANYVGRVFLRLSERVLARMPVVRGVYGAAKQIFETVLAKQSNTFREAVLVEYPRRGMWTIAFVTARTEGEVRDLSGPDPISIYVPTTPNPTSGFLIFLPRSEVIPLAMTVEEAIKMVISTGIVTPADRRPLERQKKEKAALPGSG